MRHAAFSMACTRGRRILYMAVRSTALGTPCNELGGTELYSVQRCYRFCATNNEAALPNCAQKTVFWVLPLSCTQIGSRTVPVCQHF